MFFYSPDRVSKNHSVPMCEVMRSWMGGFKTEGSARSGTNLDIDLAKLIWKCHTSYLYYLLRNSLGYFQMIL